MLIGVCLFCSGVCALVYQTAWVRSFGEIFGDGAPAMASVLAIFMGGIGVGGIALGRRVERSSNPLFTYAWIEGGVAVGAALTPFMLDAVNFGGASLGAGGAFAAHPVARLTLAAVVLGVPVVLMGGTLPAAARVVTGAADVGRKGLSAIYGLHTLGAVVGALTSTFLLLDALGPRATLWASAAVNGAVALLAFALSRRPEARVAPPAAPPAPAPQARPARPVAAWVLMASFTTGFVFFLVEIVWYRLTAPLFHGSPQSFGVVLACALFGIGAGGLAYALWGPREPTPAGFAVTCALEALCLVLPLGAGALSWRGENVEVVVVGVLVLPAALVAGWQFPMLLALKGRAAEQVGKDSGEVYAANTLGSILGSIGGGFGILPALNAVGLWRASGVVLLALAAGAAVIGRRERPRLVVVAVLAAASIVCLQVGGSGFSSTAPTADASAGQPPPTIALQQIAAGEAEGGSGEECAGIGDAIDECDAHVPR